MRVGLSWDLAPDSANSADSANFTDSARDVWTAILGEMEAADRVGLDSAWLAEGRDGGLACSSPAVFLTAAARRTRNLQLRIASRQVSRLHPVRIAEEVAVLDHFSRGRAGVSFASASSQGRPAGHVHETIDFVESAWAADQVRFRGDFVRFPSHTGDAAPAGASEPEGGLDFVPQWEWGPAMPDFLAVTPKPMVTRPPLSVEIHDDETLEWAAQRGVAPVVGADVETDEAVDRLVRFRKRAVAAGRRPVEIEAVLERRIDVDGAGDSRTLGGSLRSLVARIRDLRAATGISHLIWRRSPGQSHDLARFAGEVQLLLQG